MDIKQNNRMLERENAELRAQLGTMTELKLENERLNQLIDFKSRTKMQLLASRVVGQDLVPEHSTITINRGTYHGVEQGMAVLTVGGAVGYILQAELLSSQVILITDRFSAVDALVQRTRARGIVVGMSRELCNLNYLKRGDDVKKGDMIVTSGLDNIFPKGFPVGEVTEVKQSEYGVTQYVELKPAVNPNNLEEVFVVLNAAEEEFVPKSEEAPPEDSKSDDLAIKKEKSALSQIPGGIGVE
ncbi:MAG: rod shape-determining protein MreC [Bdellovibrionales bacterium]